MQIALIGGTGREGRGLAARWAKAGHVVRIGSRDAARGAASAAAFGDPSIVGGDYAHALEGAEAIVLLVPYSAHAATLDAIAPEVGSRLVLDVTVPLAPPKVRQVSLPPGRAAALEARARLGEGARLAAALHHVSSAHLEDPARAIDCDVLVCADAVEVRAEAMRLVEALGLRAVDAGPLVNAVALEALTPVLLHINRRYGVGGAGLRITGIG